MSRGRVPWLSDLPASQDDLNFIVPELFIEPPTPNLASETISIHWTTTRHLSIDTMHESRSVPTTNYLDDYEPLSRNNRSRSVPLSLNAVTLSKKLVFISDRFEAKHQATQRTRTVSDSETSRPSVTPKRYSDLVENWMTESDGPVSKVGSPV